MTDSVYFCLRPSCPSHRCSSLFMPQRRAGTLSSAGSRQPTSLNILSWLSEDGKKEERKNKKSVRFQGCLSVHRAHVWRNGGTGSAWVFSLLLPLLPACHMFSVLSASGRLSGQAEASYQKSYLRSVSLAQHRESSSLRTNNEGRRHFR